MAPSQDVKSVFRDNFAEIVGPMKKEEARVEANRCLYCYDAPCVQACPTHIDIPRFIKQISSDNLTGSGKTILEANVLGQSCARVCPVEVLCEGACVYHDWHEKPIQIAALQRHSTDYLLDEKGYPFKPGPDNGKKVAVIGAGPAGLACAAYLRRLGFQVTIFERQKLPGGLNTFGVAEYKLTMKASLDEVKHLFALGASVVMGTEIGKDLPAEKLLKDFDAVFVGIGLGETHRLRLPGEDLPGVCDALTFIRQVKARDKKLAKSQVTVVIGGGNTAIDAVTQSKRTGAEQVILAYRRGREEMSAYDFEQELALKDGGQFLLNASPVRILGKKKVEGVEFIRTKTVKGKLVEVKGSKFTVACDRVIKAIGQTKQFSLAKAFGLKQDEAGRIAVDKTSLRTSNLKVFAGGDSINGGKEVVNAAADGKRAAYGIAKALGVKIAASNDYWISTIDGRKVAPIACLTSR
jgi:glutamate synthase (NADPH/NADH) small chain